MHALLLRFCCLAKNGNRSKLVFFLLLNQNQAKLFHKMALLTNLANKKTSYIDEGPKIKNMVGQKLR